MKTSEWERGREKREAAALENHHRLHTLFVEDRLTFERERKRMIDDLINSVDDEGQRTRLREQQELWEKRMRHAASPHNRFVLAQTFFWDHIVNNWLPAMKQFKTMASGLGPAWNRPGLTSAKDAPKSLS